MSRHALFRRLAAASLAVALSSAAQAQTRAAASAPTVAQGPVIAGLCVFSPNQAIASSKVGGFIRSRLDQIVAQVKSELDPEEGSISAEAKALDTQRPTLDAATYQQRGGALQTRIGALNDKAALRQREVKATEDKALNRVAQELEPIAQTLYAQHHCSILVNKEAVMMANPEMDITPAAIAALDAKITQFAFDREHLEAQGSAQR